jgi:thiamine biosynthesis lipoprotein
MRELYKFEPGKEPVLPRKEDVERLRKLVGYHDILVDEREKTVRLARKGMALGTGGIAKGYALDRVGAMLESAGHKDYLLFAGGQVLVHGSRGGRAWRIGIKHPRENQRTIGFIELDQGSVSTSGDYEHYFMVGGRRFHHIIDLSTGYPSESSVSVTLIAPSGIHADALSTACFVLGRERCVKMLAEVPGGAHAVIIDADMRVHVTEGIRDRVHLDQGFLDAARP